MADIKWIKIYVDMFDHKKIKFIRKLPEGNDVLLCWVMLLSSAGKCNMGGRIFLTEDIPYTAEMLADEFGMPPNTVRLALETFNKLKMVNLDNGIFINGWNEYQNIDGMEKIREQTRKRVAEHRANQKQIPCNVTCNATLTQCNATELELELEKENTYSAFFESDFEKEKNEEQEKPSTKDKKQSSSPFFESVWLLYPEKKGKAAVSEKQMKELERIGYINIVRCINRYKKDKPEWKQWQNGSTFFNKGYIDYLDSNYSEANGDSKFNPYKEVT